MYYMIVYKVWQDPPIRKSNLVIPTMNVWSFQAVAARSKLVFSTYTGLWWWFGQMMKNAVFHLGTWLCTIYGAHEIKCDVGS